MAINEPHILSELQDALVQRAEQLVSGLHIQRNAQQTGENKLITEGNTQASRALEVIQAADSLAVCLNWLRYQTGRAAARDFWRRKSGDRELAVALTAQLTWIQQEIERRAPEATAAERRTVTVRASLRLLGYFRRALIGAEYLGLIKLDAEAAP